VKAEVDAQIGAGHPDAAARLQHAVAFLQHGEAFGIGQMLDQVFGERVIKSFVRQRKRPCHIQETLRLEEQRAVRVQPAIEQFQAAAQLQFAHRMITQIVRNDARAPEGNQALALQKRKLRGLSQMKQDFVMFGSRRDFLVKAHSLCYACANLIYGCDYNQARHKTKTVALQRPDFDLQLQG